MSNYLKIHEKFINDILNDKNSNYDWERLKKYHKTQIEFIQHERLIHLMVTLAFSFFLIISLIVTAVYSHLEMALLDLILTIVLIFYVIHYYKLENGVQRLYDLANDIEKRYTDFKL
jgi:uncharacterized membrane protein